MHQLPPVVHRASALGMFVIELAVPLGIFCGRRVRHLAAGLLIALQAGIAATGNYGFFNPLTALLCVTLYDDAALERVWRPFRRWALPPPPARWSPPLAAVVALAFAALSLAPMVERLSRRPVLPRRLAEAAAALGPLRSFNGYGLFASMTTVRPEIVVEGTLDGVTWVPYSFRWKPSDPLEPPRFVQPHMPRLDWQMWFAALQGPRRAHWFEPFLGRLLEGSPAVLALLADDPFGGRRPTAVRARLYRYEFTGVPERRRRGRGGGASWSERTPARSDHARSAATRSRTIPRTCSRALAPSAPRRGTRRRSRCTIAAARSPWLRNASTSHATSPRARPSSPPKAAAGR
jgi:hypothetical protein